MTTRFHVDGTLPERAGEIFVFGSNLAGRHGKGAALAAREHFGATSLIRSGFSGFSYAIPTKDAALQSLPLDKIKEYIDHFRETTLNASHRHFFVTRVGCGYAGYTDEQIAPLFRGCKSCSFAKEWMPFLIETRQV